MRLTRLFTDADLRADAIRRVQAIYRKAKELLEERGIRAAYLATGMARWDELFLEPAAPVTGPGTRPQCAAGAGDPKFTVIRLNPSTSVRGRGR